MLVTAVALFFSTFSTPLLSAALTLGLYIVGHFNTELRNFDQVVSSKPAAWLARALYHLLPDLSAFDVKTEVVHGLPVKAGYVLWTTGVRCGVHRGIVAGCDDHLLAGGTSSDARGTPAGSSERCWRSRRPWRCRPAAMPRTLRGSAPASGCSTRVQAPP